MRQPRHAPRYHLRLYTHPTQSAPSYGSVSVLRQGGILEDWVTKGGERKHVFFYQAEDDHYIPRAARIDLEPRVSAACSSISGPIDSERPVQVINTILSGPHVNLYNPEKNIHIFFFSKEGGGAGNGWAQDYAAGERIYDEVMDMPPRETEGSSSLEVIHLAVYPGTEFLTTFWFHALHSIADGTCSGLGSYVLNGSTIVSKEDDADLLCLP
ncbi:hypothetical protein JB92DRAFT_546001 [Gautieria morchelliformis]|nr:hypothetical protein JB92DRAFT_546001 [Gautieria morchelliformis]